MTVSMINSFLYGFGFAAMLYFTGCVIPFLSSFLHRR